MARWLRRSPPPPPLPGWVLDPGREAEADAWFDAMAGVLDPDQWWDLWVEFISTPRRAAG